MGRRLKTEEALGRQITVSVRGVAKEVILAVEQIGLNRSKFICDLLTEYGPDALRPLAQERARAVLTSLENMAANAAEEE